MMTKAQRTAEAAFWRRVARLTEQQLDRGQFCQGLCQRAGNARRRAYVQMFDSAWSIYYWPLSPRARYADETATCAYGRVLAAGLLAAMAETGDLDDIVD